MLKIPLSCLEQGSDPLDIADPLPTITESKDITYFYGSINNFLSWIISDPQVNDTQYFIYRDGIKIMNNSWIPEIPINISIDGLACGVYNFTIVANDGYGGNITYEWDFGDGSTNSTDQHPVHQFDIIGTYTVTLSVWDSDGDYNTTTMQIIALDNLPIADFSVNATSIYEGEWIQFTDESHHGDLPYTYEWDFGDGSQNSTQQNPIHQFDTRGTFMVTLTVYDANIKSNSTAIQITVLKFIMGDNDPSSSIDGYNGLIMASLISIIGVLWVSSRKRRNIGH